MYARYGFKESMPISVELTIVRYHLLMLFGGVVLYFKTRQWCIYFVETLKGKDLNRILSNIAVRDWEAYGRVLDIGGREGKSSYWRYLRHTRWHRSTSIDIDKSSNPDVVIDIEKEDLPFHDRHFDTALMFNVLEHLDKREEVLARVARVLRPDGTLLGVVPFLVAVHPDPHDFVRLTDEGLRAALLNAGFKKIEIIPVGRGPLTASYYQSEFLWPRVVKLLLIHIVLCLDGLMLWLRPSLQKKFPLSYAFRALRIELQ
jgi:SAM-dependent methyltransferase